MTKKWALITGATSGIGLEMANEFLADNINVILISRSEEKLKTVKASLLKSFKNGEVEIICADLSLIKSVESAFDEACEIAGKIAYFVNNAGFGDFGAFDNTSWEKEQRMINLNICALTLLSKLYVKHAKKNKGGSLINVASTAAFQPGPFMAVYYATKAYVLFLTEAIANELKNENIGVVALCPGPTQSAFQEGANLKRSNLVSNKKLPTSSEVAKFAIRSLKSRKVVAIHGLFNRIFSFVVRFLPRKLVTEIIRQVQRPV